MHEPHDPRRCPACASPRIVHGSVAARDDSGSLRGGEFFPYKLRLLSLERSARLMAGPRFFACLACDLVWSTAVPGHLAQLVASAASDELERELARRAGSDG